MKKNEINCLDFENYQLLGKKVIKNKIKKENKKIEFEINYKQLSTNKLLFCLNYFNEKRYILTIHEDIEKSSEKINKKISNKDLIILDQEIKEKINFLFNIIDNDKFDLNYFKLMLKDKLSKYNFENPSLEGDNYLIMLDYFKKFIVNITYEAIKDIIDRFIDYYLEPSKLEINIIKKNI